MSKKIYVEFFVVNVAWVLILIIINSLLVKKKENLQIRIGVVYWMEDFFDHIQEVKLEAHGYIEILKN